MSLDDRKKAQETKFALDKEQEFKAVARRNKLLGLWAATEMNYPATKAQDYAKEVVMADFEAPGEEDVYEKVAKDFVAAGLKGRSDEIRAKMAELLAEARKQITQEA